MTLRHRLGIVRLLGAAVVVLALAVSAASAADGPRLIEASGSSFPERAYVLTLPTKSVLGSSQVHVTENGRAVRPIALTSEQTAQRADFPVVLLVDASNSMRGKPLAGAMAAVRAFEARRGARQPLAVIAFNDKVRVLLPFTTDAGQISAALGKTPSLGQGTKIYDALSTARGLLKKANAKNGSIVLLSDGADVGSAESPTAVLNALASDRVRVFSVGLKSGSYDAKSLAAVAAATGGSHVVAANPAALTGIFDSLGAALSNQYLIKYTSPALPGKSVAVRVHVDGVPGVGISSYSAPALRIVPAPPYHPSQFDRVVESPWTAALVALLVSVLIGWGVLAIVGHRAESVPSRVGQFVSITEPTGKGRRRSASGEVTGSQQFLIRGRRPFEGHRYWNGIQNTLSIADINMTAGQLVLLTVVGTVLAAVLFNLLIGGWGILLALVVPVLVRQAVNAKLARKRRAFAEQLPENLDVLSSSLRAGHTLVGGLSVVVENTREPSKSELHRALVEERLGVPLEDALKVVVERMDNIDLDQVALVARLQREMGTESAEVLDRVVETVRARMELRRLVRTLTAQGRLSGWVLTAIPLILALALTALNPHYLSPLFHHSSGRFLLVMATLMVIAGSLIIRKIVDVKV